MATFKALVLRHQQKADGTFPIKIRVGSKGTSAYIATPWFAERNDVRGNGSTLEIKNVKLYDLCHERIRELRDICNTVSGIENMKAKEVVAAINAAEERKKPFSLDFIAYAREEMAQLVREGRTGTASIRKATINSFTAFLGRDSLEIGELNASLLKRYIKWVEENPRSNSKKNRGRAPSLYISILKAVFNKAKAEFNDEDEGVIRIPQNPFARLAVPKPKPVRKRAISVAELRQLLSLQGQLKGIPGFALDMFALSFYLIGMNAADLYSCTDYDGERIVYYRQKTRNRRADMAEFSVLVPEEAKPLVEKYRGKYMEVFDLAQRYNSVNHLNGALKAGLDKVGELTGIESLQFYAARHTWATLAVNEVGIDKYTVHSALNHVDPNMAITDMYIKKSWAPIDKANRMVLDYVANEKP